MTQRPLEELLVEERGTDIPDEDLETVTRLVRRRLLRGEALSVRQVEHEYHSGGTLLSTMITTLKRCGYVFATEEVGRVRGQPVNAWRITNPEHTPDRALMDALRTENASKQRQSNANRKARRAEGAARRAAHASKAVVAANTADTAVAERPKLGAWRAGGLNGGSVPVPMFGSSVDIYALIAQPDGSVTVGLAANGERWLATLTSFTRAPE